jgi:hypothetical protein
MLRLLTLPSRPMTEEMKNAWIDYNWSHAREHGWEPFVVYRVIRDSEVELYQKPGALLHRGNWIYQGSVSELHPYGSTMAREEAASLAAQRWSARLGAGTRPELYAAFEVEYYKKQLGTRLRSAL